MRAHTRSPSVVEARGGNGARAARGQRAAVGTCEAGAEEGASAEGGLGRASAISLDADIQRESVTLEGRERFAKVDVGDSILKLVPSEKLVPGERQRLTLRFKDGAAPASVAFILVVQAAQADTYVEVHLWEDGGQRKIVIDKVTFP